MKKLFSLLLICSISVSVFSQDLKSNGDLLTKYKNLGTDTKFYELFDACANSKKTEGCWKLGLNWDSEESDYSLVGSSKMHFYYVPNASLKCENIAFYELSRNSKTGLWQFKNQNVSISVKMIAVETAMGYQLSEIRITNLAGETCFGPKTLFKKF
jgi:hypothetical protein